MRYGARLLVVLVAASLSAATASAVLVELGTASGGIGAYFEGSELQQNTTYVQAQLASGSDRGMYFEFSHDVLPIGVSFNDIFSGQPAGQSQFGLDGIAWLAFPNWPVPGMDFADYNWDTASVDWTPAGPNAPGEGAWAINDYFAGGVYEPASSVRNSLLRGTDLDLLTNTLTPSVDLQGCPIWTVDVSGWLYTDGLIHWFYDTPETTALADWNLSDRIFFEGSFTYSVCSDDTPLYDFYAGQATLYAEVIPEPATLTLLGLGLAGIAIARRRKA